MANPKTFAKFSSAKVSLCTVTQIFIRLALFIHEKKRLARKMLANQYLAPSISTLVKKLSGRSSRILVVVLTKAPFEINAVQS